MVRRLKKNKEKDVKQKVKGESQMHCQISQIAKDIIARDFDKTEITEINRYVISNVPFSVLERVFPLTENVHNKAQVFTIIYRIVNSAAEYVSDESTRVKLKKLLEGCKEEYQDIYSALIRYENGGFGSYNHYKVIISIFENMEKNYKINKLIDIFLVFAEKQTFFDIERVAGIESSKKEGSDIVDRLLGKEIEG